VEMSHQDGPRSVLPLGESAGASERKVTLPVQPEGFAINRIDGYLIYVKAIDGARRFRPPSLGYIYRDSSRDNSRESLAIARVVPLRVLG
jgi:hypothetical protein